MDFFFLFQAKWLLPRVDRHRVINPDQFQNNIQTQVLIHLVTNLLIDGTVLHKYQDWYLTIPLLQEHTKVFTSK